MIYKITDGEKFVTYVDDNVNDEINIEVIRILQEQYGLERYKEEVKDICYPNLTKENFYKACSNVENKLGVIL